MRYLQAEEIVFTDKNGNSYTLKDYLEYPIYRLRQIEKVKTNDMIDEVGTRTNIYGNDSEMELYKIVDMNVEKLFEGDFELSKIRELRIPI